MSHLTRTLRWHTATYAPGAICDICLSTTHVKSGAVPLVHTDGAVVRGIFSPWSVCDHCNSLGSGLVCDVSVEGRLVYLHVHVTNGHTEQSFIFYPMMFRDRPF